MSASEKWLRVPQTTPKAKATGKEGRGNIILRAGGGGRGSLMLLGDEEPGVGVV